MVTNKTEILIQGLFAIIEESADNSTAKVIAEKTLEEYLKEKQD